MKSKKKLWFVIASIVTIIVLAAVLVLSLVCSHSWQDATCETAITCEKCGETQGEPLGHEWIEATCTEAKHCLKCDAVQGDILPHNWTDATCETAKTCKNCDTTDGDALGHLVNEWTITKETSCSTEGERAGGCDRCSKECTEKIEMLPHTESDWKITKDYTFNSDGTVVPGIESVICTVCSAEINTREYTVELTTGQKNAIISAYEQVNFWHCGPDFLAYDVLADFNDFPLADAKFAVAHMTIDWDEQAILYAKQNSEGASKAGLSKEMSYYGFNKTQIEKALKEVGY